MPLGAHPPETDLLLPLPIPAGRQALDTAALPANRADGGQVGTEGAFGFCGR